MAKGIIQICYRKIIDATSTSIWDKYVFEDTYKEFYMQVQQFDQQQKYTTFQEILKNTPTRSDSLSGEHCCNRLHPSAQ